MKLSHFAFAGLGLLLTACSCPKAEDYASHTPTYDIRQYLNGNFEAKGIFVARSGMADPTFHVKMKGTWHGGDGTLEEHFSYSDGTRSERVWHIHFTDEHHFTATAADVVGEAKGKQYGNAVNMRYTLRVNNKGSVHDMSINDWMYMVDKHTVLNHTTMKKFGVQFGEVIITFFK